MKFFFTTYVKLFRRVAKKIEPMVENMKQNVTIPVTDKEGTMYRNYREHLEYSGVKSPYSDLPGFESLLDHPVVEKGQKRPDGHVPLFAVSSMETLMVPKALKAELVGAVQYNSKTAQKGRKYARSMMTATYSGLVSATGKVVNMADLDPAYKAIQDGVHYMGSAELTPGPMTQGMQVRRVVTRKAYYKGAMGAVKLWVPPHVFLLTSEDKQDLKPNLSDDVALMVQPTVGEMKSEPGVLLGVQNLSALFGQVLSDPQFHAILNGMIDWNISHWDDYVKDSLKNLNGDVLEATETSTTFKAKITKMLLSLGVHPGAIPATVTTLVNSVSEDVTQSKLRINAVTKDGPCGFTSYPRALVWRMFRDLWLHEEKQGAFASETAGLKKRRLLIMAELDRKAKIEEAFNAKSEQILAKTGFAAIAITAEAAKNLNVPALNVHDVKGENEKELAVNHRDSLGAAARWPTSAKVDVRVIYVVLEDDMFLHATAYFGSTEIMQKAVLVSMDGGDADDKAFFLCGKLGLLALRSMNLRNYKLSQFTVQQVQDTYEKAHTFLAKLPEKLDLVNTIPNGHKLLSSYFDVKTVETVSPSGLIKYNITALAEKAQPADPSVVDKTAEEKWDMIHLPGDNEFMPIVGAMANAQMFGSYLLADLIILPSVVKTPPALLAACMMEGEISLVVDAAQSGTDFPGAWRAWHNIDAIMTMIAVSWVLNDRNAMRENPDAKPSKMTALKPVRKRLGVSLLSLVTAPVAVRYTGEVSEITGQRIMVPALFKDEEGKIPMTAKICQSLRQSVVTATGQAVKVDHPIIRSFTRYWKTMTTNLKTFIDEGTSSQTATLLTSTLQAFLEEHAHDLDQLINKHYREEQEQYQGEFNLTTFGSFIFRQYHSLNRYTQDNGHVMTVPDAMKHRYNEIDKIRYMLNAEELKTLRRVYAQKPIHQAFATRHEDLWPKFVDVYGDNAEYKYEIFVLAELMSALGTSAETAITLSMGKGKIEFLLDEDGEKTKFIDSDAIDAQGELTSSGGYSRKMYFTSTANYKGYAEVLCKFLEDAAVKKTQDKLLATDVRAAFLIRESKDGKTVDPQSLVGLSIQQLLSDNRIQLAYGGQRGNPDQDHRAAAVAYLVFRKTSETRKAFDEIGAFKGKTQWQIAGMMGYHGTLTNFFSGATVEASEVEKRDGHGANGKTYTRNFVWLTFKGQEPVKPEPPPEKEFFDISAFENIDYDKMLESAGMADFNFEDAFGSENPVSAQELEQYGSEYDSDEEESETQIFSEVLNAKPAPVVEAKPVTAPSNSFKSTTLGLANRIADKREVEAKFGLLEDGRGFTGEIQTPNGNTIATKYTRIVYGDHGPYIEFNADSVDLSTWQIRQKGPQAWYDEARLDGVMLYIQNRDVSTLPNPPAGAKSTRNNRPEGYADYRPGMLYVDPFKIKIAPAVPVVAVEAKPYRITFTGHRPEKIGGYDENHPLRVAVKKAIADALKRAIAKYSATREIIVVTGGALGVDTDAAREAHKLGLKFIVARPCSDHGDYFKGDEAKMRYKKMLALAHQVVLVNKKGYDLAGKEKCLHARNYWMVDNCEAVVAIWDGSPSGTSNCVNYAKKVNRPMIIINPNDLAKK